MHNRTTSSSTVYSANDNTITATEAPTNNASVYTSSILVVEAVDDVCCAATSNFCQLGTMVPVQSTRGVKWVGPMVSFE